MDLSTSLSAVQTILTAIQTLDKIQALCSISNCKRELEDLQNTVGAVKAVLEDAEAKQDGLNSQEKYYILELKDAVYDADDVMDEFLTLAKQKQLTDQAGDNKVSDKVKSFLSRFKFLTHNLSGKVKKVNTKLDAIATKSSKFSFKVDKKPVSFSKEETSSFLCGKIIGRDADVEKIVGMLLGSDDVDLLDVSFVAIVGMGGLGKTALAQLIYNDPRITSAFQMKCWSCIADQDQGRWNVTELMGKVVRELNKGRTHDLTSLEQMHHEVREQLGGRKYLLVLDDVWTESYQRWQEFENFLKVGLRGSRIVVTTWSRTTAQIVGSGQGRMHELQGLSKTESWSLFENMAFLPDQRDDDFVKLGKEIVEKCSNVPLAIRVVASLLRGQSKTKWLSFHDNGLANTSQSNDTMTHILKISYHQLEPTLKTCFAYCAIFPKDWEISKKTLIQLWMAQGYINTEYVGEEYILMLLQRCFFQDVGEDEYGEIYRFKMHDLLHDVAEQVAGDEICKLTSNTLNVGKRVRHVSLLNDFYTQEISNKTHIRTYLQFKESFFTDEMLKSFPKWTFLRSLYLRELDVEILPESLGNLLHLRFLDLEDCMKLKVLPKAITKLVNLQTLNLTCCYSLQELPNKVNKLVNLRILDVSECVALNRMPSDIGMLTCLHTLGQFVVGVGENTCAKQCFDGLECLQLLNNLKGILEIKIGVLKTAQYAKEKHGGGAYLMMKEHLKIIVITFKTTEEYGSIEDEQVLLEEMQPHPNLMYLELEGYHGETIPRWPSREDNSTLFDLPNLVDLVLRNCSGLLCLPWQVGKLPHLKTLRLIEVKNMQYLLNANLGRGSSLFPSLNNLILDRLPNLKGWWRQHGSELHVVNSNKGESSREPDLVVLSSLCLSQLRRLSVLECPQLTHIPTCPRLEALNVEDFRRYVTWKFMECIPRRGQFFSPPMVLRIDSVEQLKSMPTQYFQCLAALGLYSRNTKRFAEVREFTHIYWYLSSIRFLQISCPMLRSLGGWLEHFSGLEYLDIEYCHNLVLGQVPWRHLSRSLQCLNLSNISELEELPEGMQYCTSLQSLELYKLSKLKSLPKWMLKLVSIRKLQLRWCSEMLNERCQKPDGEDWPLIQHIPLIFIQTEVQDCRRLYQAEDWKNSDSWY